MEKQLVLVDQLQALINRAPGTLQPGADAFKQKQQI